MFSKSTTQTNSTRANAHADVSSMSDAAFFGEWDGSAWTTAGKLDYSIAGLSAVQAEAKAGNYAQAKIDLLTYYQNRTARTAVPYGAPSRLKKLQAELEADDFYFTGGEYPLATATFTTTPSMVSALVTDGVHEALAHAGLVSFMLMARTHSSDILRIHSRKNANHKPALVLNLVGGVRKALHPIKDATIRGGAHGEINYGAEPVLEIQEAIDAVVSDDTRRCFLTFDLNGFTAGSVESASVELYGASASGDYGIVVMNSGNLGYGEHAITWNNTIGETHSWTGIEGGTDWNRPAFSQNEFAYSSCRFDFADNLMAVYAETADEYYADSLIRLWLDFIAKKGNADALYTRSLDTGIRADIMVRAYHALRNSASMNAGANTAMLKFFWEMAVVLSDPANYNDDSNWGQYESRGFYKIALYFPEFAASSGWLATSKARLSFLMVNCTREDGSYKEATSHYAVYFAAVASEIKHFGLLNGESFDETYDRRLQNLGRYIMDLSRPDGTMTPFGDSDSIDATFMGRQLAADYPGRTDLLYFGSRGTEGSVPGHTSAVYPIGKYAFLKTGYGPDDLFMSVSLNDGPHGHPDFNSLTVYAYGQELLVDVGRLNYDAADPVSLWLRETEAHNTIEINGTIQEIEGVVDRSIDVWSTNGAFDFCEGSHQGYPDFNHSRAIFFKRGPDPYWIVSDYVTAPSGTHDFNQTWHLMPAAHPLMDGVSKRVTTAFDSGANIQIVPADPDSVTGTLPSGYYSPLMFTCAQAEYVSYAKRISGDTTFDTVLFPVKAADTTRDVRVERLAIHPDTAATTATALKVELSHGHKGNLGYYYLSHEALPAAVRSFGSFSFNGKMAYVETNASGRCLSANVKNGSMLQDGETGLISSPAAIHDMGVEWDRTVLNIWGSSLIPDTSESTAVAIHAPSAASVMLNGIPVPFTRVGNCIYAAGAVNGYYPSDDAYVRGGKDAGNNYAVTDGLLVKRNNGDDEAYACLRFDFSRYQGSIIKAKLRLCTKEVAEAPTRTAVIHALPENWSESTITFGNAPKKGAMLGSWTIANTEPGQWFELDVSACIVGKANKIASFSIVIEDAVSGNAVEFFSKDSTINKPMLIIH